MRSSSFCRENRRRTPGRSIIPIMPHHKSFKPAMAAELEGVFFFFWLGVGTCRRTRYSLGCSPSTEPQSGRDEDSSSAAMSPPLNPIPCYDIVPGDAGAALIRHFPLAGPQRFEPLDKRADADVTCQPPGSLAQITAIRMLAVARKIESTINLFPHPPANPPNMDKHIFLVFLGSGYLLF